MESNGISLHEVPLVHIMKLILVRNSSTKMCNNGISPHDIPLVCIIKLLKCGLMTTNFWTCKVTVTCAAAPWKWLLVRNTLV